MTSQINEGLEFGVMKGMIDNVISLDQFKPKIDKDSDVVVLAFSTHNEKASVDLNDYIQTSAIDHLDTEASPAPDEAGTYRVFVEFTRDKNLFKKISSMLEDIDQLTGDEGTVWEFTAYKLEEPRTFDKERFNRDVLTDPDEYNKKYNKTDEEEVKERMEFLVKY